MLDLWYARVDVNTLVQISRSPETRRRREKMLREARRHDTAASPARLSHHREGKPRFIDQPPLIDHPQGGEDFHAEFRRFWQPYGASLPEERRKLLDHFRLLDVAVKMVGVGRVGTRCAVALLMAEDGQPLILLIKQARASVYEPFAGRSAHHNHGLRVVVGQRLMLSQSDILRGFLHVESLPADLYVRQLCAFARMASASCRAGAGGNIGTVAAAKARPDGYTLMLTTNSVQVINPWLYKNTGFDPIKDFEPVSPVATAGYVLVANPAFPAKNVTELIAAARAKPGAITIASAGNGTLNHLIGEMLQKAAGIDLLHVPYKGAAAAATDVVSGQVPVSVQSVPSALAFINAGRLKVLGTVNEKRIAALPNVPTIGETIKGFGSTPWYGIFAPAGTPKDVIAILHGAVEKALDSKDVQDKLAAQGCEILKGSPAQFAAMVKDELPKWAKIVKESGATLD